MGHGHDGVCAIVDGVCYFIGVVGERQRIGGWRGCDCWEALDICVGLLWAHSVRDSKISMSNSRSRSPLQRMPPRQASWQCKIWWWAHFYWL